METTKKYLTIRRASYGTETPKEDREYRMFPKGGPVGTISNWSSYAKDSGFDGLKAIEKDGSIEHYDLTKKENISMPNSPFKKLLLILIILFVVCFILWKFNITFVDIVKNTSEEIVGYDW